MQRRWRKSQWRAARTTKGVAWPGNRARQPPEQESQRIPAQTKGPAPETAALPRVALLRFPSYLAGRSAGVLIASLVTVGDEFAHIVNQLGPVEELSEPLELRFPDLEIFDHLLVIVSCIALSLLEALPSRAKRSPAPDSPLKSFGQLALQVTLKRIANPSQCGWQPASGCRWPAGEPSPSGAGRGDCPRATESRRAQLRAQLRFLGVNSIAISCPPLFGRTIPLRVSGVITRGSLFATVRDRTSAPDPGGSDRSSGPDPLLTRHPPAERPGETFGPSGRPAGVFGRPGG